MASQERSCLSWLELCGDVDMLRKLLVSLNLLLLLCAACSNVDEKAEKMFVNVPSLKAYLPFMNEEAKKWAEDSYLIDVQLELLATGYTQKLPYISAEYVAPSKLGSSLGLSVMSDGSFKKEYFANPRPLSVDVPISEMDWTVDSIDAFDILFDSQARADFEAYPERFLICSHMSLRRHYAVANKLVWILLTSTCDMHSAYKFLDAMSGEMLLPNW
jgi:hypothetical protein